MIDRYTKTILTIIALALIVIVIQNTIRPSAAQFGGLQKVQICDATDCASVMPHTTRVGGMALKTFSLQVIPAN